MKSIQSVLKGTKQPKIKRSKRISLLILLLPTYLVQSLPIRARLARKTKTIIEVFGAMEDKNGVAAITPLL